MSPLDAYPISDWGRHRTFWYHIYSSASFPCGGFNWNCSLYYSITLRIETGNPQNFIDLPQRSGKSSGTSSSLSGSCSTRSPVFPWYKYYTVQVRYEDAIQNLKSKCEWIRAYTHKRRTMDFTVSLHLYSQFAWNYSFRFQTMDTSLLKAARQGRLQEVCTLLQDGANANNATDEFGRTGQLLSWRPNDGILRLWSSYWNERTMWMWITKITMVRQL